MSLWDVPRRLIARFGAGITLTRITPGAPDPDTPWLPGAPTEVVYTLDAYVNGDSSKYADGVTVLVTDLLVVASPKAKLAGSTVDLEPAMTDTLSIGGVARAIKRIEAVPAAGPPAMFNIFVAS